MSCDPIQQSASTGITPLLSADEMAAKLNISGRSILNWFYGKIIPAAVHQCKVIRFREGDVMAALEQARHERNQPDGLARSQPC
jgi:hypothetical protein